MHQQTALMQMSVPLIKVGDGGGVGLYLHL